jgi:hypothetical protein
VPLGLHLFTFHLRLQVQIIKDEIFLLGMLDKKKIQSLEISGTILAATELDLPEDSTLHTNTTLRQKPKHH